MTAPRISDDRWAALRDAARARRWHEVERRADDMGFSLVASHARRAAAGDADAVVFLIVALLLERADEPDPFAPGGEHGGLTNDQIRSLGYRPTTGGWKPLRKEHQDDRDER